MVQTATGRSATSKKSLWAGRIVSGLVILFLLMDAIMKIMKAAPAVQGTVRVGYPEGVVVGIGLVLLACTILYALPQTSVLGAILLTGYLGGAVATNVRVGNPLFGYILAPVYFGILAWLGLYLRDYRLRALVPFRSRTY